MAKFPVRLSDDLLRGTTEYDAAGLAQWHPAELGQRLVTNADLNIARNIIFVVDELCKYRVSRESKLERFHFFIAFIILHTLSVLIPEKVRK